VTLLALGIFAYLVIGVLVFVGLGARRPRDRRNAKSRVNPPTQSREDRVRRENASENDRSGKPEN
jgi:hypothetical protein